MKTLMLALSLWLVTVGSAVAQATFDGAQAGRTAVERLVKGDFAAVSATFDEKMRVALPGDELRAAWASVRAQAGAFKQMRDPRVAAKGEYQIVVIPSEFEKAATGHPDRLQRGWTDCGFNVRPAVPTEFTDASYVSRETIS